MKLMKPLFVAVFIFLGSMPTLQAQSKVAHIDVRELVALMPEFKEAQEQLEQWAKTYETDLKEKAKKYQAKVKQYTQEAETKTDDENEERMKELAGMENELREDQMSAQKDMVQKENDLLKLITEKAEEAIVKVAKAQGFDYVMNSAPGNGVIMAEGKNLLEDVKKELGL